MRASRFNTCSRLADGTGLLFNHATLSLVALDPAGADKADRILGDPDRFGAARGHRRVARLLERQGFLVPDDADELAPLRAGYRAYQENSSNLNLTILTTLACNFRCTYCYQGQTHVGRLQREVEDAIPHFAATRLPEGGSFTVTWYGGEPLLAKPTIERLSRQFLALAAERGARYEASIITNGYLLDGATAEWLKGLDVRRAQVTLDGPPRVHDRRRPLASGKGSFERIVENLKQSVEHLRTSIRMNVDEENRESIGELIEHLVAAGLAGKVDFYAGRTTSFPTTCSDGAGRCLDSEAFSLVSLETSLELTRRGLWDDVLPALMSGPCAAIRSNSFVVTPSGGLVTCWDEVGDPDRFVGHLVEPETERMAANRRAWAEYDPFALACAGCEVLPTCMSFCPYQVRETGELPCRGWKYHPKEHALNLYRLRLKERELQVVAGLKDLERALREAHRPQAAAAG